MIKSAEIKMQINAVAAKKTAYDRNMNERGEGFNPHEAELEELAQQYGAALQAEAEATEIAEWTVEITTARRAEINAYMAKKPTAGAMFEWLKSKNWTCTNAQNVWDRRDALVRAIKRHGL